MKTAVLGEALIDFIQNDSGNYTAHLGGSPFNLAIGLARQGVDVAYLSPLSSDQFGDEFAARLNDEGVDVANSRRSRWPTSLALVNVDAHGLPAYRLYREGIADKDTELQEIIALLPAGLRIFHTGSLAITPSQLPKIKELFQYLCEKGVLISIDLNVRLGASIDTQAYLAGVKSLIELCDLVKASDEDLAALGLGADAKIASDAAYSLMRSGLLLVTEGDGGARLHGPQGNVSMRAYPVAQLIDTIGAGDTFHAAFLASLNAHHALEGELTDVGLDVLAKSVDYACAAAAINVSRKGCNPPTREEVERFIAASER